MGDGTPLGGTGNRVSLTRVWALAWPSVTCRLVIPGPEGSATDQGPGTRDEGGTREQRPDQGPGTGQGGGRARLTEGRDVGSGREASWGDSGEQSWPPAESLQGQRCLSWGQQGPSTMAARRCPLCGFLQLRLQAQELSLVRPSGPIASGQRGVQGEPAPYPQGRLRAIGRLRGPGVP